mmetsp:Transcript_16908/g.52514  ORF Transcript_16908/g.52514 Transcript_16908/m.52514 type:complete len:330 (-) Transcript_16908:113-1102(-)
MRRHEGQTFILPLGKVTAIARCSSKMRVHDVMSFHPPRTVRYSCHTCVVLACGKEAACCGATLLPVEGRRVPGGPNADGGLRHLYVREGAKEKEKKLKRGNKTRTEKHASSLSLPMLSNWLAGGAESIKSYAAPSPRHLDGTYSLVSRRWRPGSDDCEDERSEEPRLERLPRRTVGTIMSATSSRVTHRRHFSFRQSVSSKRWTSSGTTPIVLAMSRLLGSTSACALAPTRRHAISMRCSMCGVTLASPCTRRYRCTSDRAIATDVHVKPTRALTMARTKVLTDARGRVLLWKYVRDSDAGTSDCGSTGHRRCTAASSDSTSGDTRSSS